MLYRYTISALSSWSLIVLLSVALLWVSPCLADQDSAEQDEPIARSDTLVVFGQVVPAGCRTTTITGDYRRALDPAAGFTLINKGNGFGNDLYLDGLKRGDITLTLDGERMTTACPNRMDTHVGRFHPLEIATMTVDRTGGSMQAGLGGLVGLERSRPGEEFQQAGYLAGAFGRSDEVDAGLILEGDNLRLLGRWSVAQAWLDGDGHSFEDLYNYVQLERQIQAEIAVQGRRGPADFNLGFQSSRDHLFPYLMMDERRTEFFNAGAKVGDLRFYANRTAHLMDTGLRSGSYKITEAENINWGVTSSWFEIYGRYWDADNRIDAIVPIDNHMLPGVRRLGATVQPLGIQFPRFSGQLRLGVAVTRAGDYGALDLNRLLYPTAEHRVTSFPMAMVFGISGGDSLVGRLQVELVRSAPEPEQLFIGLRKPMLMPTWVGNPQLRDPVRHTLRGELRHRQFRAYAFYSYVSDYPYLVGRYQFFQTYAGIDAIFAGAGLTGRFRYLDLALNWNWGEDAHAHLPLAEIQPLTATLRFKSPRMGPVRGWLQITSDFGQDRVDLFLAERTTPAWTRLDLGVALERGPFSLELSIENLADENYWQHLSYLRDPFASGFAVHEPGRTGRVMAVYRP